MLSLPQKTLDKIRKTLQKRQKEIDAQIKGIEKEDPVLDQSIAEAPESGTESWSADVHARVVAVRNDLGALSKRITTALINLKKGTYGKCEKCGKVIEPERLEAMPTATLCISCSKKPASSPKKPAPKTFKKVSKK